MRGADCYVCGWIARICLVFRCPLLHAFGQLYSTSGHWAGCLVSTIWCALSGQLIHFGAAVWFKPAKTKLVTDKPLPTGVFGIFLGYRFAPGGSWNGEYLVEEMTYFLDIVFSGGTGAQPCPDTSRDEASSPPDKWKDSFPSQTAL